MAPLLLPLWLGLAGCTHGPEVLPGVEADEAWLESVELGTVAVLGGGVSGSATLVVVDDGQHLAFPVRLRGGTIGAVLELGSSYNFGHIDLELPQGDFDGDKLLGKYKGFSGGIAVLGGFDSQTLRNKNGVRLRGRPFQFGVSVHAGYEWLRISLDPAVDVDSGWDTADFARPPDSCGCGSSSWGGGDTGDATGQTGDTGSRSAGFGIALLGLLGWVGGRRRRGLSADAAPPVSR